MSQKQLTDEDIVKHFSTYEEFLDSQVTDTDLKYLEDVSVARQLVELGYRGSGIIISREQFAARKRQYEELKSNISTGARNESQAQVTLDNPLIQALAEREEDLSLGHLDTIVFLRTTNSRSHEVSAYIDLQQRLLSDDWRQCLTGRSPFLPSPQDLSFYNWDTGCVSSKNSDHFDIIGTDHSCLLFRNKIDHKIINVDPSVDDAGEGTTRHELPPCAWYRQCVLYDHMIQHKL